MARRHCAPSPSVGRREWLAAAAASACLVLVACPAGVRTAPLSAEPVGAGADPFVAGTAQIPLDPIEVIELLNPAPADMPRDLPLAGLSSGKDSPDAGSVATGEFGEADSWRDREVKEGIRRFVENVLDPSSIFMPGPSMPMIPSPAPVLAQFPPPNSNPSLDWVRESLSDIKDRLAGLKTIKDAPFEIVGDEAIQTSEPIVVSGQSSSGAQPEAGRNASAVYLTKWLVTIYNTNRMSRQDLYSQLHDRSIAEISLFVLLLLLLICVVWIVISTISRCQLNCRRRKLQCAGGNGRPVSWPTLTPTTTTAGGAADKGSSKAMFSDVANGQGFAPPPYGNSVTLPADDSTAATPLTQEPGSKKQ